MNPLQSAALQEVKTLSFDFPESHKLAKSEALDAAIAVTKVDDGFDNALCVDAQTKLKARRDFIEGWRTKNKRPVIDLGRLIDEVAAKESLEINDQWTRLQRLASHYAERQEWLREEAERKRQAELRRIQAEKDREEMLARAKADEERQQAEAAAKAKADAEVAAATNDEDRDAAYQRAQDERDRIANEADFREAREQAQRDEAAKAATRNVILATKPTPKPQGQSVRSRWDFEVVDAGELYRARPDLCHIVEKRAEILKELAAGKREIPGLRIWNEVIAGVRT